ncbi:MAG: hypothetical protein CSB13_04845 [Chloroflexi bacterium]|nr:MAG: hypothetical protein CSB13_04845 [Chloroflexota bacterium]
MARKSLGYTELEWTCPFCSTRNPGTAEKCTSCRAPQPADVQFEQAAEDKLITDKEKIARAKAGADIHCPFCNARNPVNATQCAECLADLSDATKRQSGQTIGAHRDKAAPDVACPACGQMNAAANMTCEQCGASLAETRPSDPKPAPPPSPTKKTGRSTMTYAIIAIVVVLMLCCGGTLLFMFTNTKDVTGQVTGVEWERTINIEGLVPVEYETWRDNVPAGASLGSCRQEVHHTQPNPAPGANEVCGTPYTVDTGTGVGEVVQDCEYEVYADYCTYVVDEWRVVDTLRRQGSDHNLLWPDINLTNQQREGNRDTDYVIIFRTDGKTYRYTTNSEAEFNAAQPGTTWILKLNSFGTINDIEPE